MENLCNDRENLNEFLEEAELQQYYELFRDILKVSKLSQLKFVVTEDLVQIGLSKPEQRRYKKIYSKHFPNPYLSKIRNLFSTMKPDVTPQGPSYSLPLETLPFTENVVKGPTKHIISIEDITINKELGMGQFGVVQQGTWATGNQRLQVAIKCLGQERMSSNSTEFLKEAAVMHSIEHPSIVRLYGVVLHMDSLMLVTELAPLRSLLECLREVSLRSNFPVPNLCDFAEQICDGMTYLEHKRLIHRDLAARNILVFNKDRVKISDFGLSRALGAGKDYYQTNYNVNLKLPVAWCAPECILFLRFTSSSDVWAFGVCLWEMFTYGFQPWAAFSGQQILEAIDAPNYQRLERPECCPEAYYNTMLECWSHEQTARPKFKDLRLKLREIKPEQVQAIADFVRPEEGRRSNMLEYKAGEVITVLGKEDSSKTPPKPSFWYGVVTGGACGMFDPSQTKPYEKGTPLASISPHPTRQSSRTIRSSLLRSDVKRHTFTGKRSIQRSMISSPQGDFKHTGHVGLDGAYFGDISFLDTAGPPRQIVTPYKPSEDTEQQPLINPNSPSHLSGASGSPYPLLATASNPRNCDEVDLHYGAGDTKTRSQKKSHKSASEPTTSKSLLSRVKCATLGRSHKTEDNAASKTDEVHEYHEISDTDTESNATDHPKTENFVNPESPGIPKSYGDFGQSLLDEMESMFRNLDGRRRDEASGSGKHDGETFRSHTLSKAEKKKQGSYTGTMKPMSAHDEKTLATAVAMANEITTKSMNDLDGDHNKIPNSPSSTKFHFKFPQLSLHNNAPHEPEKEAANKNERRNFTEEANSVPDIQSILTEESKHAYSSLIEQPTACSSVMSQVSHGAVATMPKPTTSQANVTAQSNLLQKDISQTTRSDETDSQVATSNVNELPLPPRNTKPKLVDKPRHIRKYPLKLHTRPVPAPPHTSIYQNAYPQNEPILTLPEIPLLHYISEKPDVYSPAPYKPLVSTPPVPAARPKPRPKSVSINGLHVCDGNDVSVDMNPFAGAPSSANPFDCHLDDIDLGLDLDYADGTDDVDNDNDEGLVKDCSDHVSVEDLLEFADHKPCGRQRGLESDEVRIMSKVLKKKVGPDECLKALELSDWNVHRAIKLVRVKIATELNVSLQECGAELENAAGDVMKASASIIKSRHELKNRLYIWCFYLTFRGRD